MLVLSLQKDYSMLFLQKEKKNYKNDLYWHEKSEYRLSCEDYMAPYMWTRGGIRSVRYLGVRPFIIL